MASSPMLARSVTPIVFRVVVGVAACSAVSSVLMSSTARAAEPASSGQPSEADRELARALVTEADRRFSAREYREALSLYEQAYRRVHVPTVGLAVAKTQAALGALIEARATAGECARSSPRPGEPAVFGQARTEAAELERRLGQRIPSLLLELAPEQAAANVEIDGKESAAARKTPLELNPGQHLLRVTAAGFIDTDQNFSLREGEARKLRVVLQPQPNAASAASAPAKPTTSASAPTPAPSAEPRAASVDAGTNNGALVRGYVALGVAAVAAAAGGTTGALAFSSKPDCPGDVCGPESRDEIRDSKRYGTIANVSFIVAGVAGLYGLWELAFNARASGATAATDVPGTRFGAGLGKAGELGFEVWGEF